jgi:cholesterol oxidase
LENTHSESDLDYDFVIVGSGFGGSVAALRLSEKGYKVCVVEQGRRFAPGDYAKSNWDLRRYLWFPVLKCFGIQRLTFFKDVLILSGSGVGGGSLVYANTLMVPSESAFQSPAWKPIGDARTALEPFYALAKKMLGAAVNPKLTFIDHNIQEYSRIKGVEQSFAPTEVAVFLVSQAKVLPTRTSTGEVLSGQVVHFVVDVWWVAVTMPKIRSTKITFILQRKMVLKFGLSHVF